MRRINLSEDLKTLSDFRANAASYVQDIKQSKRPLVLTQNGRSSAILLDVHTYEKLLEKNELFDDIQYAFYDARSLAMGKTSLAYAKGSLATFRNPARIGMVREIETNYSWQRLSSKPPVVGELNRLYKFFTCSIVCLV